MFKEKILSQLEFLIPKAPPLLGVDISASAIKIVELAPAGKDGYRLERYVIEALPKDTVVEGNIANLEAAGESLQRAWRRLGSRVKNVAMALPASAVITKKVIIPATAREEDMEVQIESEANQYLPFALDEVNLDFQVLGQAPTGPEEVEVLIAASRKEKVEDRVAIAESAGLKAIIMDVESYAAQSAIELVESQLSGKSSERIIAAVDIGASTMRIAMYKDGQAVYVREQQVGGNQLNQEIARHFNIEVDEAEKEKKTGSLPEGYVAEVLQPFMENLSLEIARAVQFFFTSTQYTKVDHIVLAGGCAMLPGLGDVISARAQIDTVVANPFSQMQIASRVSQRLLTQDAPALLVACGLAMRRFDA
ncbi:MAG: pilus assembly protein PilM [Pseudomonadota bacterium]|nr:pilus assembly protein PilM [Pseudomonadota bacterium]